MNVHLLFLSAVFSISEELVFTLSDKIKILFPWNTNRYFDRSQTTICNALPTLLMHWPLTTFSKPS